LGENNRDELEIVHSVLFLRGVLFKVIPDDRYPRRGKVLEGVYNEYERREMGM